MRRVAWASAVVLVAAAIPIGLAAAAPGDLDPSFSGDGWVRSYDQTEYLGPAFVKGAEDVKIQLDGKIVTAGEIWTDDHQYFGVLRWTSAGELDRSFGNQGFAMIELDEFWPQAHAVAVQPDGKIVAAGQATCGLRGCAAVVRFNADGSLDRTFGRGGVVRTGRNCDGAYDLALQRDGKIVVLGWRYFGERISVVRLLPNGRLDRTFSRDGIALIGREGGQRMPTIALQQDGRIVIAGSGRHDTDTSADILFLRLLRNGRVDRSFAQGGFRRVDFRSFESASDVAVDHRGRIVAVGTASSTAISPPSVAVVRLRPNGNLDRSFGVRGKRLLRPVRNGSAARALAVQRDGRILVAGLGHDDESGITSAWLLLRLTTRGALDGSFGRRGVVVGDFGTGADWAGSIALQPDGKIVVGGEVYTDQALARYRAG